MRRKAKVKRAKETPKEEKKKKRRERLFSLVLHLLLLRKDVLVGLGFFRRSVGRRKRTVDGDLLSFWNVGERFDILRSKTWWTKLRIRVGKAGEEEVEESFSVLVGWDGGDSVLCERERRRSEGKGEGERRQVSFVLLHSSSLEL